MLWAETTFVGCGRIRFGVQKDIWFMFVCNYAVGGNFSKKFEKQTLSHYAYLGNIEGKPVYIKGYNCTKCYPLYCNNHYQSLCGLIRPLEYDTWQAPFRNYYKVYCYIFAGAISTIFVCRAKCTFCETSSYNNNDVVTLRILSIRKHNLPNKAL